MAHYTRSVSETVSADDSALHFHRNIAVLGEGEPNLLNRTRAGGSSGGSLEFGTGVRGLGFVERSGTLRLTYIFNNASFLIYQEFDASTNALTSGYDFTRPGGNNTGISGADQNRLSPQNVIYYIADGNVKEYDVDTTPTPPTIFVPAEGGNTKDLTNMQNGEVFALVSNTKLWVQGADYPARYYDFTVPSGFRISSVTSSGKRIFFGLDETGGSLARIYSIDYDFRTRKFYNPLMLSTAARRDPILAYYRGYLYSSEGGVLYRYDIGTSVLAMSDSVSTDRGKKQRLTELLTVSDSLSRTVQEATTSSKTLTESISLSESLEGTRSTPNSKSLAESLTSGDGIIRYFRHDVTLPEGAETIENRAVLTGNALNSSPSALAYHQPSGRLLVGYSTTGSTDTIYQYDYNKSTGVLSNETQVSTAEDLPLSLEGMAFVGNTLLVADSDSRR